MRGRNQSDFCLRTPSVAATRSRGSQRSGPLRERLEHGKIRQLFTYAFELARARAAIAVVIELFSQRDVAPERGERAVQERLVPELAQVRREHLRSTWTHRPARVVA